MSVNNSLTVSVLAQAVAYGTACGAVFRVRGFAACPSAPPTWNEVET